MVSTGCSPARDLTMDAQFGMNLVRFGRFGQVLLVHRAVIG